MNRRRSIFLLRLSRGIPLYFLAALLAATLPGQVSKSPPPGKNLPLEITRGWPILHGGRLKPLDTFARETVLALTGKKSLDGLSPLHIIWGFHFSGDWFQARPWIRVDSRALKAAAGLDPGEKRFSFKALVGNRAFRSIVDKALARKAVAKGCTRVEEDALEVYSKLQLVRGLDKKGNLLRIAPGPRGRNDWRSPSSLERRSDTAGEKMAHAYLALASAWARGDASGFARAARRFQEAVRSAAGDGYPPSGKLHLELIYNDLSPFFWAWILYFLAFLAFTLLAFFHPRAGNILGNIFLCGGFLLHTGGIALRWIIGGRAPLANMYESLVFMGWAVIALGLIMGFLYRKKVFQGAASVLGLLSLVFAQNLPLDSSINPLLPVLAHTYWLSLHVVTVMISYSAFALAMGLGHVALWVLLFHPEKKDTARSLARLTHKTILVGLFFLASGIVTGAVWANQSWGRYWGWDPKETWSLITFFIYLVMVHARFARWVGEFGLALFSILGFLGVLMTYYGVNFVLGTGLHSYGAAEGGLLYVSLFVALELLVVGGAAYRIKTRTPPASLNR